MLGIHKTENTSAMKKQAPFKMFICLLTITLTGYSSNAVEQEGNWFIQEEIDPLSDSLIVTAGLYGKNSKSSFLSISCIENKMTNIIFLPNTKSDVYFGRDDIKLQYRIDDQNAKTTNWLSSIDAVGKIGGNAVYFIKQLYNAKKLVLRVYGKYDLEQYTSIFEINGINSVIDRISAACDW